VSQILKKDHRAVATKMITFKSAQEQLVYIVIPTGTNEEIISKVGNKEFKRNKFHQNGFEIEETTLYNWVMRFIDETTSPRGIEARLHIREKEKVCACWNEEEETYDANCKKCYKGTQNVYQLWTWGVRGNNPSLIAVFDTEDEANDEFFRITYEHDFLNAYESIEYFDSEEDAYENAIETLADRRNISIDVAKRYVSFVQYCKIASIKRKENTAKEETERVSRIAQEYSTMIQRLDGESYKETCKRLSDAIGSRIEGKVFHQAVKLIRK
jgi:hypothetical protein